MRLLKFFLTITTVILSLVSVSCEKDPLIAKGNYLYENQELYYINGTPVHWSDDASDEIKEMVWDLLSSLVKVEGGSFEMGSASGGVSNESPVHTVFLSDYYLASVTVTQKQWKNIMGENELWTERYGKGDDYPANYVSYNDAIGFLERLNHYSGLHFRMPTEAEWEYAALGGKNSQGHLYSGSNVAEEVAWCRENANAKMHLSALLKPNELGLYDMSGNLWEWCSDFYGEYSSSESTNPTGPASGEKHVVRGGSFTYDAIYARCKTRISLPPTNYSLAVGLRLALDAE